MLNNQEVVSSYFSKMAPKLLAQNTHFGYLSHLACSYEEEEAVHDLVQVWLKHHFPYLVTGGEHIH